MKLMVFALTLLSLIYSNESLFQRGNDEYKNKNYEKALEFYHQVEESNLESVALYFNMGNSYYKLEKIGQAIRYFEKARKLSPLDDDVVTNLKLVQSQLVDHIELPDQLFIFDWYQALKYSMSLNLWLNVSLICFSLLLMSLLIRKFWKEKLGNVLWLTTLSLFVLSALFSFSRIRDLDTKKAVLIEKNGIVYTAPNADTEAFILHEGSKFDIIREEDGYYEISLIDGKTGWLENELAGEI